MFIQQMMTLPAKAPRMSAFTVDDIIEQMCSLHVFKVDPDLAIDTFRELKEAKVTDAYGRRFDYEAFRRLVSKHPASRKCACRTQEPDEEGVRKAHRTRRQEGSRRCFR